MRWIISAGGPCTHSHTVWAAIGLLGVKNSTCRLMHTRRIRPAERRLQHTGFAGPASTRVEFTVQQVMQHHHLAGHRACKGGARLQCAKQQRCRGLPCMQGAAMLCQCMTRRLQMQQAPVVPQSCLPSLLCITSTFKLDTCVLPQVNVAACRCKTMYTITKLAVDGRCQRGARSTRQLCMRKWTQQQACRHHQQQHRAAWTGHEQPKRNT